MRASRPVSCPRPSPGASQRPCRSLSPSLLGLTWPPGSSPPPPEARAPLGTCREPRQRQGVTALQPENCPAASCPWLLGLVTSRPVLQPLARERGRRHLSPGLRKGRSRRGQPRTTPQPGRWLLVETKGWVRARTREKLEASGPLVGAGGGAAPAGGSAVPQKAENRTSL